MQTPRALPVLVLATIAVALSAAGISARQPRTYALDSAQGLRLINVSATPDTLKGQMGVKVAITGEALKKLAAATPQQPVAMEQLAVVEGLTFGSGIIEAEIAGVPAPNAGEGARGFVGIAFRLQDDMRTYDAFYLRPTNGRADDQERRNHAAQYISHPDWPWFRLRKETPSKYEAYVDLEPDTWTKVKIDVQGARAQLFVHGQEQPTLVVNDVKSGAQGKGGVALWIDAGTIAHFRNLRVTSR